MQGILKKKIPANGSSYINHSHLLHDIIPNPYKVSRKTTFYKKDGMNKCSKNLVISNNIPHIGVV